MLKKTAALEQLSGQILPHGVFLVLQDPGLNIIQVSSNTQEVIGCTADALLGRPLSDVPPYLDLHYLSSDIPRQARQLYTLNWLRLIPNAYYQPVTLIKVATLPNHAED
uniref:Putative PAS/PAC sensor protein n=1 Tax=Cyanothece sp. (strain PCC 7425 / ATCC 29141) TaxID=395961 RepID=B8HRR7_CYAP4